MGKLVESCLYINQRIEFGLILSFSLTCAVFCVAFYHYYFSSLFLSLLQHQTFILFHITS